MMGKNSIVAGVIAFSLVNVISVNIDYAQRVFATSMVQLTKNTSGMTSIIITISNNIASVTKTTTRYSKNKNHITY
jgi:hypothetical protein